MEGVQRAFLLSLDGFGGADAAAVNLYVGEDVKWPPMGFTDLDQEPRVVLRRHGRGYSVVNHLRQWLARVAVHKVETEPIDMCNHFPCFSGRG